MDDEIKRIEALLAIDQDREDLIRETKDPDSLTLQERDFLHRRYAARCKLNMLRERAIGEIDDHYRY